MAIPLVVGVDGSEPCLEAVDWAAAEEALRHSVPLHLVPAAAGDRGPPDVIRAATERARKRAPTVQLSSEVLREDAIAALVANGRNAFALVLGPRGLGDLASMLLGAVSPGGRPGRRRARCR
ncbi:universal stress protein [Streptomyces pseudovenezuelae]|uniref:universal stress protein n=1 Tax=Streptomyces pseudovenezuelae TaxID=67350 RepID=UPI0036E6E359